MTLIGDKSADWTGGETLEAFAHAERFNRWMFDAIAVHCRGKILEIGSGIGNLSIHLLEKASLLTVSDMNENYCSVLQQRLGHNKQVEGVYRIDLSATNFEEQYASLMGKYDTVVALNVIEHIKDDRTAIRNCKKLLTENGRLVILVPAFQWLYNSLDRELRHFRRYSKKTLSAVVTGQGFVISSLRYFNSPGIPGWWLSGTLFRKKIISRSQLSVYNSLVPLFRIFDKLTSRIAGLSLIIIAVNNKTELK
jgi:2-polyprenyl-3-methyl-5-hydroxy-6-metoxy-1,4-benzoquinol methylase